MSDDYLQQYEPPAHDRESGSFGMSSFFGCFFGSCFGVVLLGGLLLFATLYVSWDTFVHYGINSDLVLAQELIRSSDLQESTKQELFDRIDRTRTVSDEGDVSFWEWVELAEIIDPINESGMISEPDSQRLLSELDRFLKRKGAGEPQ